MNLSIMFALASNVVPAIGWMLFHIIGGEDHENLSKLVQEEVDLATNSDGTLDASTLLSTSPLLQSMWTEVLRHYCDNMIMREVIVDTTIPLEDQGLRWIQVKKGDMVISPCWVAHHDPRNWQEDATEPSPSNFVPDRFLGQCSRDTKAKALAGVPSAKMYPFGGGKSICAGRVSVRAASLLV
jgi:cytochrome P450